MNIERKTNKKKILIIIGVTTLVLLCAGVAYATQLANTGDPQSTPTRTPSQANTQTITPQEEQAAGNQAKTDTIQSSSSTPNPSDQQSTAMQISASSQNGSLYQLRILIERVISDGKCNLILTKGSTTVSKTAPIQPLAQSSTCQGFDVPTSELSPGAWKVKVSLSDTNVSGSVTSDIEIK